jgi:predicted Zn-dependent protease
MSLMKPWRLLFFFLLIGGLFLFNWDWLTARADFLLGSRCSQPIGYRLGQVDPGYQISRQEFREQVGQAADIWNRVYSQPLFEYQPASALAVNLIYSQRQSMLDELETIQTELDAGKVSLQALMDEYQRLRSDFENQLKEFNREVATWNARGGAPPPVYEALINKQEILNSEAARINDLAQKLNLSVKNYNFQISQFNQGVQTYNLAAQEKPEAGLYDGSVPKIDIYLTVSEAELVHTLAHEFGHALGIGHFQDHEAIMYLFSSEQLALTPAEEEALREICKETYLSYWWRREGVPFLQKKLAVLQSLSEAK